MKLAILTIVTVLLTSCGIYQQAVEFPRWLEESPRVQEARESRMPVVIYGVSESGYGRKRMSITYANIGQKRIRSIHWRFHPIDAGYRYLSGPVIDYYDLEEWSFLMLRPGQFDSLYFAFNSLNSAAACHQVYVAEVIFEDRTRYVPERHGNFGVDDC